jgi:hypothetical protein
VDFGGEFVSLLKQENLPPKDHPKQWILSGFGSRGMVTIPWSVHCLVSAMGGAKKDLQSPV